jgi:hypothetical protein
MPNQVGRGVEVVAFVFVCLIYKAQVATHICFATYTCASLGIMK